MKYWLQKVNDVSSGFTPKEKKLQLQSPW